MELEDCRGEADDGEFVQRLPVAPSERYQLSELVYLDVLFPAPFLGHGVLPLGGVLTADA